MTSNLPADPDSAAISPDSDHPPPPPSRWHHDDSSAVPHIRLMCSFGGRILPRPQDNQLRYVGGDTRIVAVHRSTTFSSLLSKLCKIASLPADNISIKYQLPSEDLDSLISVTSDEDVENMMEEYDRLSLPSSSANSAGRSPRLRLFLFPASSSAFGSILDTSPASKHDRWFLDALNGSRAPLLERGRSEASSIVSEVPDYLFGLDTNSDEPPQAKPKAPTASDPGSPAPVVSSPHYASVSSAPDLPPVNTKPEVVDPQPLLAVQPPNPVWQYVPEPVQVYYVPGPVTGGSLPVRPVAMPVTYVNAVQPAAGGQIPVGYRHPVQGGPVYVGGPQVGRPAIGDGPYEYPVGPEGYVVPAAGGLMRSSPPGMVPVYPGTAGNNPAGGQPPASNVSEMRIGRASQ